MATMFCTMCSATGGRWACFSYRTTTATMFCTMCSATGGRWARYADCSTMGTVSCTALSGITTRWAGSISYISCARCSYGWLGTESSR